MTTSAGSPLLMSVHVTVTFVETDLSKAKDRHALRMYVCFLGVHLVIHVAFFIAVRSSRSMANAAGDSQKHFPQVLILLGSTHCLSYVVQKWLNGER